MFLRPFHSAFGSSIMRISYGIDVDKEKVPYLTIAEDAMQTFSDAFVPGKYLVETFPLLRFLPSWFPGAKFKREGTAWTPIVSRLRDTPWDATVAAMVRSDSILLFLSFIYRFLCSGKVPRSLRSSQLGQSEPRRWKTMRPLMRMK